MIKSIYVTSCTIEDVVLQYLSGHAVRVAKFIKTDWPIALQYNYFIAVAQSYTIKLFLK